MATNFSTARLALPARSTPANLKPKGLEFLTAHFEQDPVFGHETGVESRWVPRVAERSHVRVGESGGPNISRVSDSVIPAEIGPTEVKGSIFQTSGDSTSVTSASLSKSLPHLPLHLRPSSARPLHTSKLAKVTRPPKTQPGHRTYPTPQKHAPTHTNITVLGTTDPELGEQPLLHRECG